MQKSPAEAEGRQRGRTAANGNSDLAHRPLRFLRPQPAQERRRGGSHVRSIREFGFKIPVLARSDGEVVDGHLRLKAARKLGSGPAAT